MFFYRESHEIEMDMVKVTNVQDEFNLLVEDIRLGRVLRPYAKGTGTGYQPVRITDFDLAEVPVFFGATKLIEPMADLTDKVTDELESGNYHLPYETCCFMFFVGEDAPSIQRLEPRLRHARYYLSYLRETKDAIHIHHFSRHIGHRDYPAWIRQTFAMSCPVGGGEYLLGAEPDNGFPDDFLRQLEHSAILRGMIALTFFYQLTHNQRGEAQPLAPTEAGKAIVRRREKLGLPPIQPVRLIRLGDVLPPNLGGHGKGRAKKAHYRRGTWVSLKNGTTFWRSPTAIHGGTGAPPPWYEVRSPRDGSPSQNR